jgi:hypothetical protein
MQPALKIPISAIAKLSKNISRPTLYKIVAEYPSMVEVLLKKEEELASFYDDIFKIYKIEIYKNRSLKKKLIKKQ